MAKTKSQPILVPSTVVEELFAALSAAPRMTHCGECGHELLHVDVTFFSSDGKTVTLPLPICSECNEMEERARHDAA